MYQGGIEWLHNSAEILEIKFIPKFTSLFQDFWSIPEIDLFVCFPVTWFSSIDKI